MSNCPKCGQLADHQPSEYGIELSQGPNGFIVKCISEQNYLQNSLRKDLENALDIRSIAPVLKGVGKFIKPNENNNGSV